MQLLSNHALIKVLYTINLKETFPSYIDYLLMKCEILSLQQVSC